MLDTEGLQATLRRFAADRGWEPFHSPKNLAMALMVEAAELAEIFQWMTPEQSRGAHSEPAVRQHVGEELADVLLYLLQVADQCHVDLNGAVLDKLAKNARKHPTTRKAALDQLAVQGAAGAVTHVLLDYENVQPSEDELRALVPEATRVWVFHGPHQKRVAQRFASYGDGLTEVPISRSGKNALDFHLSFYMGYIASRHPDAHMVVLANDQGYSPMLDHAKAMGFAVRQLGYGPRRQAPAKKASARKTAAGQPAEKKAPAKKAVAQQVPAKQAPAKRAAPAALAPVPKPAPVAKKTTKAAVAKAAVAKKQGSVASPALSMPSPAPKAAAKKKAPAGRKQAAAAPAPTAVEPAQLAKLIEALRKMPRRPAKAGSLRRAIKPWLGGATVSEQSLAAAFDALVAAGVVAIGAQGEARYPLFG